MTYYTNSDEYYFEFDTSGCGTGTYSCFYTSYSTSYENWLARWSTTPAYGYYGMNSGTNSGDQQLRDGNGGFITVSVADGFGMNLIMHYDSTGNQWGVVGVGTETSIDEPLTGGSSARGSLVYGYTQGYVVDIPGNFTGTFGKFDFNATSSSSIANRLCVTTNGWYYFFRTYSSYDQCTSAYYMIYGAASSYRWSGFALGSGYYGSQATSGSITYKLSNVAPTPDTFKPDFIHTPMSDSHAADRTVSVVISDAGDPPSGLDVSTTAGTGPTLYYRITPDGGSAGSWTSSLMTQDAATRAACEKNACTWSSTIEDLEVNDTVEYYFTAQDTSTVASTPNSNTSSTYSFQRGDPTKVFIVEWRDMGYYTYGQYCTVQALFYDVTNEIEFKYDTNCKGTYNSWSIGYMDQTRSKGASILNSQATSYNSNPGHTPMTNNFRIATSSSSHGWESFDQGLVEVTNAQTAMSGTSSGTPYSYYCWYYWSSYANYCNKNIDLPAGFDFEYFGTLYEGDDSNDRV